VKGAAKSDTSLGSSKIAEVRTALNEAVKRSDVHQLTSLLTDDVAVVHEDGRCTCGKQEVEAFFLHAFARYDIEGTISSADVIVHDKWAIEMDEVDTTRESFGVGAPIKVHYKAILVYARQPDFSWKVARFIELAE
jgi:ketosteroid isomerase-like protein